MPRLLLLLAVVALTATVPAAAAAQASESYVAGEVLVRFEPGAQQGAVERAAGVDRAEAVAPRTRVLRIEDGESVAATVRELRARPDVATAAPNAKARIAAFYPNDPGNSGVEEGWQALQWNFLADAGVDAPDAWENLIHAGRPGGRGTVVAVLDTGVAYANHGRFRRSPDFRKRTFVRGYDFVDRDRFPNDENGHGTHVAGTIAERTHNDRGVTGLAYGAKIMPVRVLDKYGAGESGDITRGIRFAVKHGADVINLSFEFDDGIRQFGASEIPDVLAALRFARRKGVLVVAAAGNFGRGGISYPARYRSVMAVGATTEHACRADYSNIGRGLDIVAPGGGADAPDDPTCPTGVPRGRDIFQMTYPWAARDRAPRSAAAYRRFGLPSKFRGTSMASPHVAATAALVIASGVIGRHPTPYAIRKRLEDTAIDGGPRGHDEQYGAGRLDAAAATSRSSG